MYYLQQFRCYDGCVIYYCCPRDHVRSDARSLSLHPHRVIFRIVERVCAVLCSVLECYTFLSFLSFTEYNIIGFPGISMGLFSEHGPCLEHDHETLRPIIVSTWMPEKVGGLPGKSLVFAESQVSVANNLIDNASTEINSSFHHRMKFLHNYLDVDLEGV